MNLYVVRHGQTIVNVKRLINARNPIGLNRKGKEQARNVAQKIKDLKIDLIICSPLRRTRQTCNILNINKIKVIYDKRLLERHARSMQFKEVQILDKNKWYDINASIVYKNAEGFKSIRERVKNFLEEIKIKYPNKNILIVTHGDVCKAIYSYLNNINDANEIAMFEQKNCGIVKYEIV